MPQHLLFVALTGHGHVTPTLPLVAELVRRGHRVDYATAAEHSQAVTAAGAHWVALPPMAPFSPPAQLGPDVMAAWFRHFFAAMDATYPVLLDRCTTQPPDAICYDATNWPARLVAEKLGIPAIRCVPHLASNEVFSLDAHLTDGLNTNHPAMAALATDCARFATEHGVHLDPAGTLDVPENLNLVFVPKEFQPAADTFDNRFQFIGPTLSPQQEHWSPRDPATPTLFISLGSILTDADFYRTCLAAFATEPWQVAMTVANLDPTTLGPLPSNVDIRPRFPQLAVLQHAAAFISHAGMNSTMEALCYGVPLVTFPQTPEQAANADRVQELGLGERLNPDTLTPESLRATVTRVSSSPTIRTNLARMRKSIQDSGGASRGADEIERYLGRTPTAVG